MDRHWIWGLAGGVAAVGAGVGGYLLLRHRPPVAPGALHVPTAPETLPTTWRGSRITRRGGTVWLNLAGPVPAPTSTPVWVAQYVDGTLTRVYPQAGWPAHTPWVGGISIAAAPATAPTAPETLPTTWRGSRITRRGGTVWLELTGAAPTPNMVWVAEYRAGRWVRTYRQRGWRPSLPWTGGTREVPPASARRTRARTTTARPTTSAGSVVVAQRTGLAPAPSSVPPLLPNPWRGTLITRPLGTVWLELTGAAPTADWVWVAEYQNGRLVRVYPQHGWPADVPWSGGYAAPTPAAPSVTTAHESTPMTASPVRRPVTVGIGHYRLRRTIVRLPHAAHAARTRTATTALLGGLPVGAIRTTIANGRRYLWQWTGDGWRLLAVEPLARTTASRGATTVVRTTATTTTIATADGAEGVGILPRQVRRIVMRRHPAHRPTEPRVSTSPPVAAERGPTSAELAALTAAGF